MPPARGSSRASASPRARSAAEGSDDADASRRARAGGSSASRPPGRVSSVTAEQPASHYASNARSSAATRAPTSRRGDSSRWTSRLPPRRGRRRKRERRRRHRDRPRPRAPARELFQTIARALDSPPTRDAENTLREMGRRGGGGAERDDVETKKTRVEDVEDDSARAATSWWSTTCTPRSESVRVPARSMTAAVDGLVRSLLSIPTAVARATAPRRTQRRRRAGPGALRVLRRLNAVADARLDVAALRTGARGRARARPRDAPDGRRAPTRARDVHAPPPRAPRASSGWRRRTAVAPRTNPKRRVRALCMY